MINREGLFVVIGPGRTVTEAELPQSLGPESSPSFTGLFVTGLGQDCVVYTTDAGPGGALSTDPAFTYADGVLGISRAVLMEGFGRTYWENQGRLDAIYIGREKGDILTSRLAVMDDDIIPVLYAYSEDKISLADISGSFQKRVRIEAPLGKSCYLDHVLSYSSGGTLTHTYFRIGDSSGFDFIVGNVEDGAVLDGGFNFVAKGGGGFIAGAHGIEDVFEVLQTDPGFGSLNAVSAFPYGAEPGNMCPGFRTEDDTLIVLNQSLRTTDDVEFALLAHEAIGGQLYIDGQGLVTADSAAITAGTLISGTVADTRQINAIYLQVQEVAATPGFLVDITFENITGTPKVLHFKGRYQGNVNHNVKLQVWNYNTLAWENITAEVKDIPHTTTDMLYTFDLPGALAGTWPGHYVSAGQMQIRINHTSAGNAIHDLFIDYIAIQQSSLDMAIEGTPYILLNGMQACCADNIILTPGSGEAESLIAGKYKCVGVLSLAGSPNVTIQGHVYIDGVRQGNVGFKYTLPTDGAEFQTMAFAGYFVLAVGQVVTFRLKSDLPDSWISANDFSMILEYVGK